MIKEDLKVDFCKFVYDASTSLNNAKTVFLSVFCSLHLKISKNPAKKLHI